MVFSYELIKLLLVVPVFVREIIVLIDIFILNEGVCYENWEDGFILILVLFKL